MRVFIVAGLLVVASVAEAQTPVTIKQSLCTVSWTAPQTNADGTNLTDLKEYGVYVGTALNAMQTPTAVVPAPSPDPAAGATASWPCKTLPVGVNHFVQVDGVDTSGNRSVRTAPFGPFVLQDDASPAAPSGLLVGP